MFKLCIWGLDMGNKKKPIVTEKEIMELLDSCYDKCSLY